MFLGEKKSLDEGSLWRLIFNISIQVKFVQCKNLFLQLITCSDIFTHRVCLFGFVLRLFRWLPGSSPAQIQHLGVCVRLLSRQFRIPRSRPLRPRRLPSLDHCPAHLTVRLTCVFRTSSQVCLNTNINNFRQSFKIKLYCQSSFDDCKISFA